MDCPTSENVSLLTDYDVYLFNEGTHYDLHDKLGAHIVESQGEKGVYFAVWAPDAEEVSVIGDFNAWRPSVNRLRPHASSGIWQGFIPGLAQGELYKYQVSSRYNGYSVAKADPYAAYCEVPPRTGSVVWDLDYAWGDSAWMAARGRHNALDAPISVYELHLGSWLARHESGDFFTYREIAPRLVEHVKTIGFTHVELMPITEHPFYGSWGYQTTGYFAPTSRYGTPQDFMFLVDQLHQNGIGVILDWVPGHFPSDEHGLGYFDGTHLYEHSDPNQAVQPDWNTLTFNYGRHEVRSFLISSAMSWLERYHIDGLRVDAVASMIYLDYSRSEGQWTPNAYGGRENLEALAFLRQLNTAVYGRFPDVQMIAEESTAWPMVSRPVSMGGLGFGLKWDMGWMHDTLKYLHEDPIHRRYHHHEITFRALYAFTENYILPLSHDEVVHGKRSLVSQMPGDDWQKFANLRLLYSYMYAQPGKKLLFMGGEFAQWNEWQHDYGLDWHLAQYDRHEGVQTLLTDLNQLYRQEPALHLLDCDLAGFEWIDGGDAENSVLTFLRKAPEDASVILVACNFTPVPRHGYRIGVPAAGYWRPLLNSDATQYWGSGVDSGGKVAAEAVSAHGRPLSIEVTLPPLAALFFKHSGLTG
jgi:1,4-alpha-glucan branching enzyme